MKYGLVHSLRVTTAKDHDSKHLKYLLNGEERFIGGDKAHFNKALKREHKSSGIIHGVLDKAPRGKKLSRSQRKRNNKFSKVRCIPPEADLRGRISVPRCKTFLGSQEGALQRVVQKHLPSALFVRFSQLISFEEVTAKQCLEHERSNVRDYRKTREKGKIQGPKKKTVIVARVKLPIS